MRTLRFHRELYRFESVDAAMGVYERFATITKKDDGDHRVLEIEAASPERERRIADELANYALGLTIRGRSEA